MNSVDGMVRNETRGSIYPGDDVKSYTDHLAYLQDQLEALDGASLRPVIPCRADTGGRFSSRLRFFPVSLFSLQLLTHMTETTPKITAYLKTFCGWSEGIRAIMRKYELPFEEKDIIKNPAFRWEMEQRSGQSLSPCVEINGHMLPDISGEEVETWMRENGYLQINDQPADAPINSACTDEQHEAMALGRSPVPAKIRFID
jgi:monothiol glutaredoxin